jgi:hypothetical protein
MITQTIKQTTETGENDIRIEHAENLDDAKKNNFKPGEYNRFFINNEPVSNYMVLVKYLVEETKRNKKAFIPDENNLKKIRKETFAKRNEEIREYLESVKKQYNDIDVNSPSIKRIDEMINKIDDIGMRVVE